MSGDRTENSKLLKKCVKTLSVLGNINGFRRRAENFYPVFIKEFREFDSRLTAECNNNAARLLSLDYVHNVLFAERLKIKPVARVKVR